MIGDDLRGARKALDAARAGDKGAGAKAADLVIRAVLTSEGLRPAEGVPAIPEDNPLKADLVLLSNFNQGDRADQLARVERMLGTLSARLGVDLDDPKGGARTPIPIR